MIGLIRQHFVLCLTCKTLAGLPVLGLVQIGGPLSFFSRMRIFAGGQILEDIDMYNRVHEMFSIFSAIDSRQNDYAEGFGSFWDNRVDNLHVNTYYLLGIPGLASQTVLCKPLSGILNQRKYLPIRFMPLTIELSLVDDMDAPVVTNLYHGKLYST